MIQHLRIIEIFASLGAHYPLDIADGLTVTSPADGALLGQLRVDTAQTLDDKTRRAQAAQQSWAMLSHAARADKLEAYAGALKRHRELLAELITREAGKTTKEALIEVDGSADTIFKTIKDASLPEISGMLRRKERSAIGVVGLITSFNFPLVVAHWTLAPALLAGNGVVWKPSEKTPLVALAAKAIWDSVMGAHGPLMNVVIGLRDVGETLVAHAGIGLISATGSVGMGKGIRHTLSSKEHKNAPSILELGGNNGLVISSRVSDAHLAWVIDAILHSFFGTSGQRCTNTRRLFVHRDKHAQAVALLRQKIDAFLASSVITNPLLGDSNEYGFGPLIDADAFSRFEKAKAQSLREGGEVLFGKRMFAGDYPDAYYVEPALALMPQQTEIMHEETFAPLLFVVPYEGKVEDAAALVNAPRNAGLVSGIYTQSQKEADCFAALSEAGHIVINSPKGTGTPAYGMGFGGNKDSGEGEILNAADPLAAFTKPTHYRRIAQHAQTVMDAD